MNEIAIVRVRLYPSTHRRLKIRMARLGIKTLAELVEKIEREYAKK